MRWGTPPVVVSIVRSFLVSVREWSSAFFPTAYLRCHSVLSARSVMRIQIAVLLTSGQQYPTFLSSCIAAITLPFPFSGFPSHTTKSLWYNRPSNTSFLPPFIFLIQPKHFLDIRRYKFDGCFLIQTCEFSICWFDVLKITRRCEGFRRK